MKPQWQADIVYLTITNHLSFGFGAHNLDDVALITWRGHSNWEKISLTRNKLVGKDKMPLMTIDKWEKTSVLLDHLNWEGLNYLRPDTY